MFGFGIIGIFLAISLYYRESRYFDLARSSGAGMHAGGRPCYGCWRRCWWRPSSWSCSEVPCSMFLVLALGQDRGRVYPGLWFHHAGATDRYTRPGTPGRWAMME